MNREIADGRRARKVNFAVDVEIAAEIEKVKHGHGKRETSERRGGRSAPRLPPCVQEASQVRRRAHAHSLIYIRAHLLTYSRAIDRDQVTAFPCYRSTRGRHGNLFNVSGTHRRTLGAYTRASARIRRMFRSRSSSRRAAQLSRNGSVRFSYTFVTRKRRWKNANI